MEFTLTTPALLFSAISLLLLAYTNRFLALAALMRDLRLRYKENHDQKIKGQIANLSYRIRIIRDMQVMGVLSFFLCVTCMILYFIGQAVVAQWVFGFSLLMLLVSLGLSLRELQVSIDALNLQMQDLDED
jgi:hypothetical protein